MNKLESLSPLKADKHSPHTDKMSLRYDSLLLHFHRFATCETDLDASGKKADMLMLMIITMITNI